MGQTIILKDGHNGTGRIGPNAVIRLGEALQAVEGTSALSRVFRDTRLEEYLDNPPTSMVDEREVASLHRALHGILGDDRARTIGWLAGQRTADYLLRHRIPRAVTVAMRCMPSGAASRLLAVAIMRNAWTFAGTGRISVQHGRPTIFSISDCPICRGATCTTLFCDFYTGTFERLFARLVHPRARVDETSCLATGGSACTFAVRW